MATVSSGLQSNPRGAGADAGAESLRKRRGRLASLTLEAAIDEERQAILEIVERQAGNKKRAPDPQRLVSLAPAPRSPLRSMLDIGDDRVSARKGDYKGDDDDGAPPIPNVVDGETYSNGQRSLSTATTPAVGEDGVDRDSSVHPFPPARDGQLSPGGDETWPKAASTKRVRWMLGPDKDDIERGIRPPHQKSPALEALTEFSKVSSECSRVYFPVTAVPGHELQPGPVTDVARALAAVDHAVLLIFWVNPKEAGVTRVEPRHLGHTLRALEDGLAGREKFHRLYPGSPAFSSFWRSALHSAVRGRLMADSGPACAAGGAGPRWDAQTREECRSVERHAERLREVVLEKKDLVMPEKIALQRAIEARWRILVDILDAVYHGSEAKREIADWDGLFSFHDVLASSIHADVFGSPLGIAGQARVEDVRSSSGDVESAEGLLNTRAVVFSKYITSILWLSFLAAVPLSILAFALALRYSEPTPGTTTDGDFWLLFQSCGMQLVSLASIVAPVWGGSVVTGHARVALLVFIGAAGVSTILAPLCYVQLPKAWSGFVVIILGCINAFATLQMALAMRRARDKR